MAASCQTLLLKLQREENHTDRTHPYLRLSDAQALLFLLCLSCCAQCVPAAQSLQQPIVSEPCCKCTLFCKLDMLYEQGISLSCDLPRKCHRTRWCLSSRGNTQHWVICRCLSSRRMSLDADFKIGGDKRACRDVQADRPARCRRYSVGPCDVPPEQFSGPVTTQFPGPSMQAFREISNVPPRCAPCLASLYSLHLS